jgi:hypothetical protein
MKLFTLAGVLVAGLAGFAVATPVDEATDVAPTQFSPQLSPVMPLHPSGFCKVNEDCRLLGKVCEDGKCVDLPADTVIISDIPEEKKCSYDCRLNFKKYVNGRCVKPPRHLSVDDLSVDETTTIDSLVEPTDEFAPVDELVESDVGLEAGKPGSAPPCDKKCKQRGCCKKNRCVCPGTSIRYIDIRPESD